MMKGENQLGVVFIKTAGLVLLITAVSKLASSFGSAIILNSHEPIFHLSFRHLFWLVGTVELVVAIYCLRGKNLDLASQIVTYLSGSFFVYRLGLWWVGYKRPCPCLGNLTDALHIQPQIADMAMKIALGYLFLGSCALLLWNRRKDLVFSNSR